jgi:hypothetical protein
MAKIFPSVPDPMQNMPSLQGTSSALKESVEILTRQRGDKGMSAVTWYDLVELGLIPATRIPK